MFEKLDAVEFLHVYSMFGEELPELPLGFGTAYIPVAVLPASSVEVAVIVSPLAGAGDTPMHVHAPVPSTITGAFVQVNPVNVTIVPISPVPEMVAAPATTEFTVGSVGAVVSILMLVAGDAADVFPAVSSVHTVIAYGPPSARATDGVIEYTPPEHIVVGAISPPSI